MISIEFSTPVYLSLIAFGALAQIVSLIWAGVAKGTEGRRDDVLVPLVSRFIWGALVVSSVLVLLHDYGVDLMAPLAGLGVSGIMVALALQPLAKDFMAAVQLFARHPFSPGQYVKIAGYEGIVEDMNFSTVTLRTGRGERVFIPAGQVTTSPIVNCSASKWRPLSQELVLAPGFSKTDVDRFCMILACDLECEYAHENLSRGVLVYPVSFDDAGVRIRVDIQFDTLHATYAWRSLRTRFMYSLIHCVYVHNISLGAPLSVQLDNS